VRKEIQETEGEPEAEKTAGEAQHETFEKELLDDPDAAGTECSPDGDLALTYGATGQEKACDIDARDDPEKCRGSEEGDKSAAHLWFDEGGDVVTDAS
jgi:hypothetical protein